MSLAAFFRVPAPWATMALGGVLLTATPGVAHAQDPARFENEIHAFEASDRTNPPPQRAILFAGSSSFRMWKSLAADFPTRPVINRGFGGSHMSDLNHFFDRIVLPYRPKTILVYEGDNDLAAGKSPETLLADFQSFVRLVQAKLPKTRVAFVAIKPSPSRRQLLAPQARANDQVRQFVATNRRLTFIDVVTPMVDASGEPRAELFIEDRLHMNSQGYALWHQIIEEYLAHPDRKRTGK